MSCTHGKTETVCGHNRPHCCNLSGRALSVSEVILSDFFSNRNYNTLPSDHRSQTQGQRDCNLHPVRNEFCSEVDVLLVIGEDFFFVGTEFRMARLLHDPQGLANNVHVVAEVARPVRRDISEQFEFSYLIADLVDVLPQSQHRIPTKFSRSDVVGQFVPSDSSCLRAVDMVADHLCGLS